MNSNRKAAVLAAVAAIKATRREALRGDVGPKGDTGPVGAPGERGVQGVPGAPGSVGKDGRNGNDGATGKRGARGETGEAGRDGRDGKNGEAGVDGEGFNWRGPWKRGTDYKPRDVVQDGGSSWVAIEETVTAPALSSRDWDLMAAKGDDGFSFNTADLPITGGTLTGPLAGTTANFNGDLSTFTATTDSLQLGRIGTQSGMWLLSSGAPNSANYAIKNAAGSTLINSVSGLVGLRINDSNILTVDSGQIQVSKPISGGSSMLDLRSSVPVSAAAVVARINSALNQNVAGAKLLSIQNNGAEKVAFDKDGLPIFDSTDASATPGAATINKPSGRVALVAGQQSVVVTNSLVTANSKIFLNCLSLDATLFSVRAVPTAGSFTITGNTTCTAICKVDFLVVG